MAERLWFVLTHTDPSDQRSFGFRLLDPKKSVKGFFIDRCHNVPKVNGACLSKNYSQRLPFIAKPSSVHGVESAWSLGYHIGLPKGDVQVFCELGLRHEPGTSQLKSDYLGSVFS